MKQSSRIIVIIAVSAAVVAGCNSTRQAAHTEYRYIERLDSIILRMSDTILIDVRGDSVYIREKVVEYRDRVRVQYDTIRISDTIREQRTAIQTRDSVADRQHARVVGFWFGILFFFLILLIFFCLMRFFSKKI